MEKWISDHPDFAGEACREWMKDLYQENRLVEGEFAPAIADWLHERQ